MSDIKRWLEIINREIDNHEQRELSRMNQFTNDEGHLSPLSRISESEFDAGLDDEPETPVRTPYDKELGEPEIADAEEDVSELIHQIEFTQNAGLSMAAVEYPIERLYSLPADRVKSIYNKVMGEVVEEYLPENTDADNKNPFNIQVGDRLYCNWGAMYPTEETTVEDIETRNGKTWVWHRVGDEEDGTLYQTPIEDIRNYGTRSKNGSPIGITTLPKKENTPVNEEWHDVYRDMKGMGYSEEEAKRAANARFPEDAPSYGKGYNQRTQFRSTPSKKYTIMVNGKPLKIKGEIVQSANPAKTIANLASKPFNAGKTFTYEMVETARNNTMAETAHDELKDTIAFLVDAGEKLGVYGDVQGPALERVLSLFDQGKFDVAAEEILSHFANEDGDEDDLFSEDYYEWLIDNMKEIANYFEESASTPSDINRISQSMVAEFNAKGSYSQGNITLVKGKEGVHAIVKDGKKVGDYMYDSGPGHFVINLDAVRGQKIADSFKGIFDQVSLVLGEDIGGDPKDAFADAIEFDNENDEDMTNCEPELLFDDEQEDRQTAYRLYSQTAGDEQSVALVAKKMNKPESYVRKLLDEALSKGL